MAGDSGTSNAGGLSGGVRVAIVVALILAAGAVVYLKRRERAQLPAAPAAAPAPVVADTKPVATIPRLVDLGRGT